jgi:hypothetical protein
MRGLIRNGMVQPTVVRSLVLQQVYILTTWLQNRRLSDTNQEEIIFNLRSYELKLSFMLKFLLPFKTTAALIRRIIDLIRRGTQITVLQYGRIGRRFLTLLSALLPNLLVMNIPNNFKFAIMSFFRVKACWESIRLVDENFLDFLSHHLQAGIFPLPLPLRIRTIKQSWCWIFIKHGLRMESIWKGC